jgi:hypothetical protein
MRISYVYFSRIPKFIHMTQSTVCVLRYWDLTEGLEWGLGEGTFVPLGETWRGDLEWGLGVGTLKQWSLL